MDSLPNETLEHILIYVHEDIPSRKHCGAVCWNWRLIMQDVYRRWSVCAREQLDSLSLGKLYCMQKFLLQLECVRGGAPEWFIRSAVYNKAFARNIDSRYIHDRIEVVTMSNVKKMIENAFIDKEYYPFVAKFTKDMKIIGAAVKVDNLVFAQLNGTYVCNGEYISKRLLTRVIVPLIGEKIEYEDFRNLLSSIFDFKLRYYYNQ